MNDYKRMRRQREYASATFYDDAPNQIGSMTCIECYEDSFQAIKLNWGAEEDYERNKDGEVEQSWKVVGAALERLKKACNIAKKPETVVEYLKERFFLCRRNAYREVLKWLDEKQIIYTYTEF